MGKLVLPLVLFIILIWLLFLAVCGTINFLQTLRVAKPFPPGKEISCRKFREDVNNLRTVVRHDQQPPLSCKAVLADLSIQEDAQNVKPISEPKEKLDLLLSSQLLLTASEAMQFVRTINFLDFVAITCREVEETFSPGVGEGIAYADFHRTGEDYKTHLICDDDRLIMVFPTNNGSIDEYDRETVFSLLGSAAGSAVTHGVKKAIP